VEPQQLARRSARCAVQVLGVEVRRAELHSILSLKRIEEVTIPEI
jgi:hypothetical protein